MSNRMERANSEIQKALIEIIHSKMNDPRLNKIVSVTEVKVTPDFKYCKAKISVLELDQAATVAQVLQKSEGFIKRELAKMLDMPQVPKINFVVDKSTLSAIRVEEILRTLNIPKAEEENNSDDDE
ncbi:MAG: 30S ribosome-binding factor RbfA [Clostridia bacterium]|nr:30S ribosome-binding factor RbfA [Clostridia bacterium]